MARLKYILIAVVMVGLIATLGCGLFESGNSPNASPGPIDPDWQPVYVDEEVDPLLSTSELVEKLAPTVVSILTEKVSRDIFFQPVPERGAGSGVIIDPKGYIVTNNHVVQGASTVQVVLSDGRSFDAVKWSTDPWTDLAVVEIQLDDGEDLPFAHFLSDSLEKLEELEEVVAVGNALALPGGPTWTKGVISNLGRAIRLSQDVVLHEVIQTDAAINPGNSGGPLVNMSGQVVGINTAIAAGGENIGFAISTDSAIPVVNDLIREQNVPTAWLGVSILTVTPAIRDQYELAVDSGALVAEVVSGSPADKAGLMGGDVVVEFGGVEIATNDDLVAAIQSRDPGDTVHIAYWRENARMDTEATLVQRPAPQ